MLDKSEATLIYVAKTIDEETGSPKTTEITKTIQASIYRSFSNNYYNDRGREMREAYNLVVNTYHTFDIEENGLVYQLQYVIHKNIKYTVMNILHYEVNKLKGKEYKMNRKILDLQKTL